MKARDVGRLGGGLDDASCAIEAEVEELAGGVEAVAGLGVIDLALHDVDEEADYVPAVVGLLADDVGEGIVVFFGLLFCVEHMFYGNGCGRLGSRGDGGEGSGRFFASLKNDRDAGVKCGRRGAVRAATANQRLRFLGFARNDRGALWWNDRRKL